MEIRPKADASNINENDCGYEVVIQGLLCYQRNTYQASQSKVCRHTQLELIKQGI
jgi:hypothetical protein